MNVGRAERFQNFSVFIFFSGIVQVVQLSSQNFFPIYLVFRGMVKVMRGIFKTFFTSDLFFIKNGDG